MNKELIEALEKVGHELWLVSGVDGANYEQAIINSQNIIIEALQKAKEEENIPSKEDYNPTCLKCGSNNIQWTLCNDCGYDPFKDQQPNNKPELSAEDLWEIFEKENNDTIEITVDSFSHSVTVINRNYVLWLEKQLQQTRVSISDEEIIKKSEVQYLKSSEAEMFAFEQGAKWMREKLNK